MDEHEPLIVPGGLGKPWRPATYWALFRLLSAPQRHGNLISPDRCPMSQVEFAPPVRFQDIGLRIIADRPLRGFDD